MTSRTSRSFFLCLSVAIFFFLGCASQLPKSANWRNENSRGPAAESFKKDPVNLLNFKTVVDLNDPETKGKSFLSLMKSKIKPALDEYARNGFLVAEGSVVREVLKNVDPKVARDAIRDGDSEKELLSLADRLSKSKTKATVYNLPELIDDTNLGEDKYGLSTFLALASGGGVAVKINDENICYNVNYGAGNKSNDEMTGRSFGQGPGRLALDASDKFYLKSLQDFVRNPRTEDRELRLFYESILKILIATDAEDYRKIPIEGQIVATDFLAVYVAEQDRHMMADLKSHAWDEALLEVTLLSAFHAGQKTVKVMFKGKLTETTLKQEPGGEPRNQKQRASMIDYWQFSESTGASSHRSGINITRKEFRALGRGITQYQMRHNPALVKKVQAHFKGISPSNNLFADLSRYLINFKTPEKIPNGDQLAQDYADFLMQVRRDADAITSAMTR